MKPATPTKEKNSAPRTARLHANNPPRTTAMDARGGPTSTNTISSGVTGGRSRAGILSLLTFNRLFIRTMQRRSVSLGNRARAELCGCEGERERADES